MKRTIIISLLVAAMGMIAFVGCEKEDTTGRPTVTAVASQTTGSPTTHNTTLSYTDCHSHQSKGMYDPVVLPNYDNGVLQLTIENFCLTCGVYTIVEESEIDVQTITVDFGVIYESQANCICSIDVDYSIDNIKPGNYELIIKDRNIVMYQEEITCE
ncbi:MAG: hypothetical protein J5709_05785 [Bacteroidales bacterium]|nr:hypothetical protein [Bacteroidales bacterium]